MSHRRVKQERKESKRSQCVASGTVFDSKLAYLSVIVALLVLPDLVKISSKKWLGFPLKKTQICTDEIDDTDYTDYSDYAHENFPSGPLRKREPASSSDNESLKESAEQHHMKAVMPGAQPRHQEVVNSIVNAVERERPEVSVPATVSQKEGARGHITPYAIEEVSRETGTEQQARRKQRCPHHPHAQKVRFDPSGQAWCDKLDCWDCYRLMRIGQALGYPHLPAQTGRADSIEQGIEAWSAFVTSRSSFNVMVATDKAITFCRTFGIEVPDLSGEVKRLVDLNERGGIQYGG